MKVEAKVFRTLALQQHGWTMDTPSLVYKLYVTCTCYGAWKKKCNGHIPRINQIYIYLFLLKNLTLIFFCCFLYSGFL